MPVKLTRKELLRDTLDMVLDWAAHNPDFDSTFVEGLSEQLDESGDLTPKQVTSLENIIDKWGIE